MHPVLVLALFPAIPFVAAAMGWVVARWSGRRDAFWRTSLPVFVALASALGICSGWPPVLGFDLVGGVRIVYEIEQPDKGGKDAELVSQLAETLRRRIDPNGTDGKIVRPYGPTQVEILIPKPSASEMEHVKGVVVPAGHLQFRILADTKMDEIVCLRADHPSQAESRIIADRTGEPVAEWVKMSTDETGKNRIGSEELLGYKTRTDPDTGETEILVLIDPFNVEGQHLARAWAGYDNRMQNCIHFTLSGRGALRFSALTGANLPDPNSDFYRKLGILMDQKLISAPRIMGRISDRGQITGNFTLQEVEFLAGILKAGRLPARIKPLPVSEDRVRGGERSQWALWCVAATLAAMLLISAYAGFRYGRHGVAAAVAAWLGTAMLAAGLLMAGVSFTFPTVVVACAVALALAISLAVLSGVTRTCQTSGGDSQVPASASRSWPVRAVIAFVPLFAVAAVLYMLGFGEVRQIAQLLVMGSISGVAGVVLCFWPLKGFFAAPADLGDAETGVVMAKVSENDASAE